ATRRSSRDACSSETASSSPPIFAPRATAQPARSTTCSATRPCSRIGCRAPCILALLGRKCSHSDQLDFARTAVLHSPRFWPKCRAVDRVHLRGGLVQVNSISAVSRRGRIVGAAAAVLVVCALGAGAGNASRTASPVRVAYLSYAVANSYDAPMLAAAKAVAKAQGSKVTVFDAANDPKKQLSELQTVASSKQYQAIIVQPIFGPQLTTAVQSAIKSG